MTTTLTRWLSVTDVAEVLGCSRGHVYDLIAAGRLTSIDIGAATRAKTRISETELQAFIQRQTH